MLERNRLNKGRQVCPFQAQNRAQSYIEAGDCQEAWLSPWQH